jgi:hypothetical protein
LIKLELRASEYCPFRRLVTPTVYQNFKYHVCGLQGEFIALHLVASRIVHGLGITRIMA